MKYVVVYGGRTYTNPAEGGVGELSVDSRDRVDVALRVAREKGATLVFGVGPQIPHLAETTLHYIASSGWSMERVLYRPEGSNSLAETAAAISALRERGDAEEVVAVTSWYHVPRVALLWWALGRPGVRFIASWRAETLCASLLREVMSGMKLWALVARRLRT